VAASNRCPIIMNVMNRALSAPINIHCDHSDAMGARDSSWIQVHAENVQEAYDNIIQAVRIGEQENVRLPVMTNFDGFTLSHATERLEVLEDAQVQAFVGEFKPMYPIIDVDNPVTYGPLDLYDYYFEHKRQQVEAMELAHDVVAIHKTGIPGNTGITMEYLRVSWAVFSPFSSQASPKPL